MATLPTWPTRGTKEKFWIFENPNTKAGDVREMCQPGICVPASLAGKKWDSDHNWLESWVVISSYLGELFPPTYRGVDYT